MLEMLQQFIEAGHSRLAECAALFLIPFLHDDLAVTAGSLLVIEHEMPLGLTVAVLHLGMVASDLALYGLGWAAARNPAVRRAILSRRIERFGSWLKAHAAGLIALARPIPGLMFPVYVTCGLYRAPFLTFAKITFATAAVYLPLVFLLVSGFGSAILSRIGYWPWLAAIALVAVGAGAWLRSPGTGGVLTFLIAGPRALLRRHVDGAAPRERVHRGMPVLAGLKRTGSRAERIPELAFYLPLALQWTGWGCAMAACRYPPRRTH